MTSLSPDPSRTVHEPPGHVSKWAWAPLVVLILAMGVLWGADFQRIFEPAWLLFTCNFVFATLASAVVFRLLSRSFLAQGEPTLLLLACGVTLWGLAGILAVGFADGSANAMITIHNICAWLSAAFHLLGILWSEERRRVRAKGWWLLGGLVFTVGLALGVVKVVVAGWTAHFFVQDGGGTVVRGLVLGSAAGMFALSGLILRSRKRQVPSVFAQWYGLGLWLIAAGLAGLAVQTVHGNAFSWMARSACWLGGIYLLAAARTGARQSGALRISLALPPTDVRVRYSLAAVFVAVAVLSRMLLSDVLGPRVMGVTFYPAIILAALYGGRGPGLLAGILSIIAIDYFWIGPFGEFYGGTPGDWIALALIVVTAAGISFLAEAMLTARSRATAAEAEVRLAVERQRLEQAAHQVEQQLAGVLAGMSDGFELVDAECRVTYLNAAARRMFSAQGLDPDQMIGRHLWEELFPDLRDSPLQQECERTLRDGVPGELVNFYKPWQRWYGVRIFPAQEGGLSLVFQDITERTAAEETRARLAAIVENSDDAIIGKTLEGIITSWNRGAEQIFGYSASEIVGQPVTMLIPPDRQHEEADILGHIRRGEPVGHFDSVRRRKDGSLLDVSLTFSPIMDREGKIIGASKIARDITARKQAEALSVADLEAMTQLHRSGSLCAKPGEDFDICLGGVVEAAVALTGAKQGNLQLLDEDSGMLTIAAHRGFDEAFLSFFASVPAGKSVACGSVMLEGERLVVEDVRESEVFAGKPAQDVLLAAGVRALQSTPLVNSAGKVFGIISTHRDAPGPFSERELRLVDLLARQVAEYLERKQAEEKLRSNEALYRTIGESIRFGVWVCAPDGRNLYASQSFLDLVGLTQEQCSNFGWGGVLHPDEAASTMAAWEECVRTGGQWNREHRFRGVDGRWHHVLARGMPVKDEEGKIAKWGGINLDVSDLKAAEEALSLSEQRFRTAVGLVSNLIWTNDAEGKMKGAQPGWENFTGQTMEEYQDFGWAQAVHPEDAQPTIDAWHQAVAEQKMFIFEHRIRRADGEWRLCAIRATPLRDDDGAIREWVGVHTDITDQKRSEEILRHSEERHRALVTASSDILYRMSADWSELGPIDGRKLLPSSASPNRSWLQENLFAEDWPQIRAAIDEAIRTKGVFALEHRVRRADGSAGWTVSRAVPVLDANGRIVEWFGTASDVTERRQAEEALRESEARKNAILDSALDAIITMDHEGRLVEFNGAAERIFGHARADVLGQLLGSVIIPERLRERHAQGLARYLATGEGPVLNKQIELPALRADGSEFPAEIAIIPIPDTQPPLFTAFLRDVTERKALEGTLVARAEQLAQADRSKDEFLAMLAHELRNPLAPLRNAAELLKTDDAAHDERAQAQQVIDRQIENMSRMLEDLLDVSRITAGKIELRRKSVPLEGILTAATSLVRSMCAAQQQQLSLSLPKEPVYLDADATRLEQVFGNLLGNACKYSGDGCHISVSAERIPEAEPPQVIVRVKDNGTGIAPELLPHIFDLFVQASRTLDRSHGGLGIGLTLVQRLVKLHGGRIEARSEGLGRGAEFVVHLPILTAAPPPEPQPAAPSAPSPRDPARRILIVDDNTDSARTLAMLQKRRGHEIRTAFTGPDAVAAAVEFLPEVVLLDIGLPGMDGFEVARRIRGIPALADALLIAMSGYGREEDRAEARSAGFDDYMVKPVDLGALRDRIYQGRRS